VKKKPLKIAAIKEENYGLTFAAEKIPIIFIGIY
jgi:hypothetical protein